MARVKGRDVLLDLMETVARLDASSERHAEALEALAGQMAKTTAQVAGLTELYAGLSSGMRGLSQRMDDMSRRMDDMSKRMDDMAGRLEQGEQRLQALEDDMQRQHELTLLAASSAREHHKNVGRLGKLVGVLAESSSSRFDAIEARVDALEKKTG